VTNGGERSWISEAVSLSTTIIGPPHLGQDQRSLGPAVEASCSVCGAPPSSWKESGKVVARLRLARKPKLRMRTKPSGSRCNRKRRKNSSRDRVSNFCSLLWAESRQRKITFPSAIHLDDGRNAFRRSEPEHRHFRRLGHCWQQVASNCSPSRNAGFPELLRVYGNPSIARKGRCWAALADAVWGAETKPAGAAATRSSRQIFIVHGHDTEARDQLELALHRLGLARAICTDELD
jgi:hypothetical protein